MSRRNRRNRGLPGKPPPPPPKPPSPSWWQPYWKRFAAVSGAIVLLVSLYKSGAVFWPSVAIEATSSPQDPSTLSFRITNIGPLPLEAAKLEMALCDLTVGGIKVVGNGGCAFMSPPNCGWCVQTMPHGATKTIDLREIFNEMGLPPEARMMPEGSQTGVRVSFRVWKIPHLFRWQYPYELKRSNDGHFYWAPGNFSFAPDS